MKIQILVGLIAALAASTDALECYTCSNVHTMAECRQPRNLKTCQSNEGTCELHVRRRGNQLTYYSECKATDACRNNVANNPTDCDPKINVGPESVCRCCCQTDRCNCLEPDLFCTNPEGWEFGVVECGDALASGFYSLGHQCQLICAGDTELEQGASDTITCQRDPNSPGNTIWVPDYPTCVETDIPGCIQKPEFINGSVLCDPEPPVREDGKWSEGDTCTYICPEGSTLVGIEQAVCLPVGDGSGDLAFTPGPPCCEPKCDPDGPADILFVLDHSTSITAARWPMITEFVNNVIDAFDLNVVHFGVVVYGNGVLEGLNIPFDYTTIKRRLQRRVRNIPYNNPESGTHTVAALNFSRTDAFQPGFGDRADVPNFVIFVTDGVSYDKEPLGGGRTTLNVAAELLHEVTNQVYAVGVGKFVREELEIIATRNDFIGTTAKFAELNKLLDEVKKVTCERCPICLEPQFWEFGEIECEEPLYNGQFLLGQRCGLTCFPGSEFEDGAVDFITCRQHPLDPNRGVWLPLFPTCVFTPPPGCELPPVWEDGIVTCVEPRPEDGFWNEGDTCEYTCPEGDLVGSSQATCQSIGDGSDNLVFLPEHPCCEPDCDPNRPVDILFILDHSTSITAARWPIITTFVNNVIERFDTTYVHFGVTVYGRGVLTEYNIPFGSTNSKEALQETVSSIPYDNPEPGTHTVAALEYARNSAFKPEFGDREDVDNYIILVTDGVSYDSVDIGNGRTTLDLAATLLKELTAKAVAAVGVGDYNESELRTIASSDDLVATVKNFEDINKLLDQVTTVSCPRQCPVA